jgi:hypothetical protein
MKQLLTSIVVFFATVQGFAQDSPGGVNPSSSMSPGTADHMGEIALPILFITFLIFMLITLVKHFLEFRLKNKLIDRGMSEQLSAYLVSKNDQEKQNEIIKIAILFCGIGTGLTMIYLTAPIHLHSLAIMAFSVGLSYFAYFFYLRKKDR